MASNGAEHLASLPAYVINLDRSTDRWALVASSIEPFVGSVTRVPGVDGAGLFEADVLEFRDMALGNEELKFRCGTTMSFWRGVMGCYLAHIRAITTGMAGGVPFLVLEDDARFYRQDLAEATNVPGDADIYIWGGGLKRKSRTSSYADYAKWDGQPNLWKPVGSPLGVHCATAVEFRTMDAAIKYLSILVANPHVYDVAWWQAMRVMDFRVLEIEVVSQCPILNSARGAPAFNKEAARLLLESLCGTM